MFKIGLPFLFFLTAILYASVGFGGGSTYTALLVLFETDYRLIPTLSLLCNILVVIGSVWRYRKAGLLDIRRAWPFFVLSVPAAWLGGRLVISETLFIGLLSIALMIASLAILFRQEHEEKSSNAKNYRTNYIGLPIGGAIGFLSGLVGIGGGIFLSPILFLIRWDQSKKIAATCSAFILVNSLFGLLGQASKLHDLEILNNTTPYIFVFPAVIIGGMIGNYIGIQRLSQSRIRILSGLLILFVGIRLLWRLIQGL